MVSRENVAFGGISSDATVNVCVCADSETDAYLHATRCELDLGGFEVVYFKTALVTDGPACRASCLEQAGGIMNSLSPIDFVFTHVY